MTNKVILVTGANGGLGKETVRSLVEERAGRVVMAGRSADKLEKARAEILRDFPAAELDIAPGFDMGDLDKIEQAVARLDDKFDIVFLQAGGVVFSPEVQRVQGIERTIFQNVLGGHAVLYALNARGLVGRGARVVVAGGEGARGIAGLIKKPQFSSTNALREYVRGEGAVSYHAMNAMGVSKFVLALWSTKLAQVRPDLEVLWFSPGLTYGTQGLSGKPALQRFFLEKVAFNLMALTGKAQSPRAGARKYVDALLGRVGKSGDVIGAPEGKALGDLVDQRPMNAALTDDKLRDAFWEIAQAAAGPIDGPVEAAA